MDSQITQLQETGRAWFNGPITLAQLCQAADSLGLDFSKIRVMPAGAMTVGLIIIPDGDTEPHHTPIRFRPECKRLLGNG